METRTKGKIAIGGSALMLAGALSVGLVAFGGTHETNPSPGAAAPASGTGAQRVDLNTDPSNSPSASSPVPDLSVHLKVKNFGAFTGWVCMPDAPVVVSGNPNEGTAKFEPACTGDILPLKEKDLDHNFDTLPGGTAKVTGGAREGNTIDLYLQPGTHCLRLDGTTRNGTSVIPPFQFKEVSCNGF